MYSFGKVSYQELSKGYYDFNIKDQIYMEGGISVDRSISEKIGIGIGVSLKRYKFKSSYALINPVDGRQINTPEFELDVPAWGLRINGRYNISEKVRIRLITEINNPFNIKKSHETNILNFLFFLDAHQGKSYSTLFNEYIDPTSIPAYYIIPEGRLEYGLSKNISVYSGIKYKAYGGTDLYRLEIFGDADTGGVEDEQLNDSRILTRFLMIYVGVSYNLPAKFFSK
ncbi:MAG: hypothetical protein GY705_29065 [Bacteroidetes bacterium]|nr:hypothetical protein [Bacteroidota bacterium]